MAATIIDGAAIAAQVKADVEQRVRELAEQGHRVHLVALLAGASPAGELYARRQGEACGAIGIDYTLVTMAADATQKQVKQEIRRLNADAAVTGIMMHLPLPEHLDA